MQPVIPTMDASGVRALVDRRTTPQAQGAKVRAQGVRSGQKGQRSEPASAQAGKGCSNNIQLQPPLPPLTMQIRPTQHDAAISATCVRVYKEYVC